LSQLEEERRGEERRGRVREGREVSRQTETERFGTLMRKYKIVRSSSAE
jgi:hypothetical protein